MVPSDLRKRIRDITPHVVELRHHLHEHPELSNNEERTAACVAKHLAGMGLRPTTGVGGHGVVADIHTASASAPLIALRADMDALPIQEENDLPYRSVNPGVMHACGHDGHTAMLVGAAAILTDLHRELPVGVRLIFQPAEEDVGGARRMCDAGVMSGVTAIAALHGWVELPLGSIGIGTGAVMAAADMLDVTVRGRGAHAASPHLSVDPIVTAARIVEALQTAVSRESDPLDNVVITVAQFHAGTAYNIIPDCARLAGTVRTLRPSTRERMEPTVRRIAEGICASAGAQCDVAYQYGAPAVINGPKAAALIREAAIEAVGAENVVEPVTPSMGAEDFAYYLRHAPGAMFRLGLGDGPPGHTSRFDFDDRALPVGVEMFCRICFAFRGPLDNSTTDLSAAP